MSCHQKNLSEPFWTQVANGYKTVEGRLNSGKSLNLRAGDYVIWSNEKDKIVKTRITEIVRYSSFEEMIRREKLSQVLPGVRKISEGVSIYRKIYSEEDEKQYGVLAIRLALT